VRALVPPDDETGPMARPTASGMGMGT